MLLPSQRSNQLASEGTESICHVCTSIRADTAVEYERDDWILGVTAPSFHEPVELLTQLHGIFAIKNQT